MSKKKPMSEEQFNKSKKELIQEGIKSLYENPYSDEEARFIIELLLVLCSYNYGNRLEKKGSLGHIIVDRWMQRNNSLVNDVSYFDYKIS